jgi:FkbM family methyltransferase
MLPNYEGMLECFYRAVLGEGDVAIDIGAHIGRHSLPMAQEVGAQGRVLAFEPLPTAYSRLVSSIEKLRELENQQLNISTYNMALGEEEGVAEFVYVPDFPEYSGFRERTYHDNSIRKERINVEVRRLDSFVDNCGAVRFIKIDAEGGELVILRGGLGLIGKHLPIVSFELGNASLTNYPYGASDYYDFFSSLGYSVFSIFGLRLSREEFISAAEEQFFWDYVALPPGAEWTFGLGHIKLLLGQLRDTSDFAQAKIEEVERSAQAKIEEVERVCSGSS